MTIDEYHVLNDFDIRMQYYHGCEMVHITSYNWACLRHDAPKNNSMGDVWSLDNGFWLDTFDLKKIDKPQDEVHCSFQIKTHCT